MDPSKFKLRTRGEYGSLAETRKAKGLIKVAKKSLQALGVISVRGQHARSTKLYDVLKDIAPSRHFPSRSMDGWFVQIFLGKERWKGVIPYDPCLWRPPMEVARYMAKTQITPFRLPAHLYEWLKDHAAKTNTTMSEIVRGFIEDLRAEESDLGVEQI